MAANQPHGTDHHDDDHGHAPAGSGRTPTPASGSSGPTWAGSALSTTGDFLWNRLLPWNWQTEHGLAQARYQSLREQGEHDAHHLDHAINGQHGHDGLHQIRERDVEPANAQFLRASEADVRLLHEVRQYADDLQAAAEAHRQAGTPTNIDPAFWTNPVAELGNESGEDFVNDNIAPLITQVEAIATQNHWRRGTGGTIQQAIRIAAGNLEALATAASRPTTVAGMRLMVGTIVTAADRAREERERVRDLSRESLHTPPTAVPVPGLHGHPPTTVDVGQEFADWRGTYDANANDGKGEWSGIMGILHHIAHHHFWELPHALGQHPAPAQTIAQRAQAIIASMAQRIQVRPGHPIQVQQMQALERELGDLLIDMNTALATHERHESFHVHAGTDRFESDRKTSFVLRRLIGVFGAALLGVVGGMYATSGPKEPPKMVQKEKKTVSVAPGVSAHAVDNTTIIVTLPEGTNPANFGKRFFALGPGGKEADQFATPVYKGNSEWALEIPAALRGEKSIRIKYSAPDEGGAINELGQVDVPLPGATGKAPEAHTLPDQIVLSEACKVQVYPPKTLAFALPPDTTTETLKGNFIIAIHEKGTDKHRIPTLIRTERGWEAELTDDEVKTGIELTVAMKQDGVMGYIAQKTAVPLKR